MSRNLRQMKKKVLASVLVALSAIGISSFCIFHSSVLASAKYYNEALVSSIVNCVDHGVFKSTVKADDLNGSMWAFITTSGTQVYTPLGFLNDASDPNLVRTCTSIIQKQIANKGLSIPKNSSSADEKDKFLKSLGYKKSGSSEPQNNESCFRLIYNYTFTGATGTSTGEAHSAYACVTTDEKGNIVGDSVSVSGDRTVKIISFTGGSGSLTVKYNINGGGVEAWGSKTVTVPVKSGGDSSFEGFKTRVKDAVIAAGASKGKYEVCYESGFCDTTTYDLLNAEGNANVQVGGVIGEYTLTVDETSKRLITGTLTGSSAGTYPTISEDSQFSMYEDYLNKYYQADVHCEWTADQAAQKKANDGYVEVATCDADGVTQPCLAKATANANRKVGGIDGSRHFGVDCDFNCVASWLASYGNTKGTCPKNEEPEPTPTPTPNPSTTVDEDFCDKLVDQGTNGEGVGAMQWILCPTLSNTTYTANWVDNMTQDMLEVNSDLYKPGSPTQTAWSKVRDVSNVVMAVFLLVVVFSQVTGYGIDNYGIKKMLPRIIMMAIIINLSFYICAIIIDISNIAGVGLRDLFGGVGAGISGGAVDANTGFISTAVTGLFSAAGIGGGAALGAGGAAVTLGAPLVVAVLIAAIVLVLIVIVAVVILYLMLGVREIIIIFCVLISPLAFVAFVLPNTQHLFKKWWELFKAAIIIFPLCGAVSGISFILKNITTDSNVGIGTKAVMMVLPFVGFFFLPMLLKQAIAGLGKLGGAISTMGQTMRNGARTLGQGAMRAGMNSERAKTIQAETARRRQSESSQRTIDKLEALKKQREDEGRTLTDPETRRLARAHETQRRLGLEDQAARTILTEKDYAGKSLDDLMADWNTAFDSGDTNRMDALTNVIVSRHGPGGVSQIASSMADKNIFEQNVVNGQVVTDAAHPDGMRFHDPDNNGAMEKSFNALQANMMQNSALANAMQNKASDVFQMVSGGGYVDGKRQNVAAHAANNGISTQMKDWATQSNGTLRRASANGGLSAQMARDILKSTDPAIQSGIQSDKDKRATLEAIAGGYKGDWSNANAVQAARVNYTHEQALAENAEFDMTAAEMRQAASQTENLRRAAESLERLSGNQGFATGSNPGPNRGSNPGFNPGPNPGPNNGPTGV